MATLVKTVTRQQLEARRAELLREMATTQEGFRRVLATQTPTAQEWDAKEELDEIAFLLGEDRH